MTLTQTVPTPSPAEVASRSTFLALMWALSRPGRLHELPRAGSQSSELGDYVVIADTLLDLETTYYTTHAGLAKKLERTGARAVSPELASYLFFTQLREKDLPTAASASRGDYLYPDRAATLIIGCVCNADSGVLLRLSGPGIPEVSRLRIGGIPKAFWTLRAETLRYPSGWDVFLVSEHYVVGLPRTTTVELEVC